VDEPLSKKNKLNLYKIAIEEYRFEVRLGWDRTTYFLGLNTAILTVSTGLLKLDNPPIVYFFIAVLFLFGGTTSIAGAWSIRKAHEYYRKTIVKKTVIEEHLGLNSPLQDLHSSSNFAVGTTTGQTERMKILQDPQGWIVRPLRKSSVTFFVCIVLWVMAAVNVFGVVVAATLLYRNWTGIAPIITEHLRPLF
jgi:hypothetical protein